MAQRLVGIELEFSGQESGDWYNHRLLRQNDWSYDNDCSIPKLEGNYGVEIISAPEYLNDKFKSEVEEAFESAEKFADQNNTYFRYYRDCETVTGFHVHVDAEGLAPCQKALAIAWFQLKYEDIQAEFPDLFPYHRKDGPYTQWFRHTWFDESLQRLANQAINNSSRFYAVNITNECKTYDNNRNTIEFRGAYMPGNAKDAWAWMSYCENLVKKIAELDSCALRDMDCQAAVELLEGSMVEISLEEVAA